jgi:hypothetical protein
MKKLLLILLLAVLPVAASAQDGTTMFTGFRMDDGLLLSVGASFDLGKGFYLLEYTDVGHYASLNTEFTYLTGVPFISKLRIGPIAGPDSDWFGENNDNLAAVQYWSGASGVLVVYDFTEGFGAWGFGKYKFALDKDANFYPEGSVFGAGVYVSL